MLCVIATIALLAAPPLHFERQKIGEGIYEACSIFDVNKDKHLDIVHGEYWYPGPDFAEKHKIATILREGDYYDDFSNYPMDVNGDGYLDIVTGGWWGMSALWRENPKGKPVAWTNHEMAKVGNVERNCFYDLDGDGIVEVFSTTKPVNFFRLNTDRRGRGTGSFTQYVIEEGGGGHGFGCGDLNGDGRPDLLYATGWHEGPKDPFDVKGYQWHPIWNLGLASCPILVHDVNKDGRNDIIVGQGHDYGLAWYEQVGDPATATGWKKHDIETDKSQFHEMQLHDLDKDGEPELITGKRYRAHNENDPGAADPLGLYYYKINGGAFERTIIDYGPAGQASGTGIYLWIADIDKNGWPDILAPGKEGLYLFLNQGPHSSH